MVPSILILFRRDMDINLDAIELVLDFKHDLQISLVQTF